MMTEEEIKWFVTVLERDCRDQFINNICEGINPSTSPHTDLLLMARMMVKYAMPVVRQQIEAAVKSRDAAVKSRDSEIEKSRNKKGRRK